MWYCHTGPTDQRFGRHVTPICRWSTSQFLAILFDIDGTLSNVSHRRDFVENGNQDWEVFFVVIPEDEPNEPVVELART